MKEKEIWSIENMTDYAISKYFLKTGFNESQNLIEDNYKRTLRRTLEKLDLAKFNKRTGKYEHKVTKGIGKYVVDIVLKDYFSSPKRCDEDRLKKAFLEQDKLKNEKHYQSICSNIPITQECADGVLEVTNEEIENAMFRVMIKALFELFYTFDEKQFFDDYKKRDSLISEDYLMPLMEGYSFLDYKLCNPTIYYCIPKNE